MNHVCTTISLREDLHAHVAAEAERMGLSMSQVVERLLTRAVAQGPLRDDIADALQQGQLRPERHGTLIPETGGTYWDRESHRDFYVRLRNGNIEVTFDVDEDCDLDWFTWSREEWDRRATYPPCPIGGGPTQQAPSPVVGM